jgi:phosphonoacetate hydrolase
VVGDHGTALGKSPQDHDLRWLEKGLRSHGGMAEQEVLFALNKPVRATYRQRLNPTLRNFDIVDFVLNGVEC